MAWFLAERDLRGWVPERGWVHAGAHGADLLGTLAASRYLGSEELRVLLDVIAERLLIPTEHRFAAGEDDRLFSGVEDAYETMALVEACFTAMETAAVPLDRD